MELELVTDGGPGKVILTMTRDELYLLLGSVNEAIEAVEDWEFSSRLGAEKDDARELRETLAALIDRLPVE